jgi:hypothetical protein
VSSRPRFFACIPAYNEERTIGGVVVRALRYVDRYVEVVLSLNKINYAYHLQDQAGKLVFRYDNEPHYPELATFPHHKHVSGGVPEASEDVEEGARRVGRSLK